MSERVYRYLVSLLILASLGVLFLYGVGFRFTSEDVIEVVRKKDPLYHEIVYTSKIDRNKYVAILEYGDDAYAPLIVSRQMGLWHLEPYFYEDVTKMGMIKTDINGVAYTFDSVIDSQLNFMNLSLRDQQDLFIVIDSDADQVCLVDSQDKLLETFEKQDDIFVLKTDLDGFGIVSYGHDGSVVRFSEIEYQESSIVNVIDLHDGTPVREFRSRNHDKPEIHRYRDSDDYINIPFVSSDMLEKPVMRLEVNMKVPLYVNSIEGVIKEYDGHKTLTYYKNGSGYILQVYRYWDGQVFYYEMDTQTYLSLREKVVGWYYGNS